MCGFVGIVDTRGEVSPDASLVARMAAKLIHRGPDSSGSFSGDGVGLGFRRLSIIDLKGGDQPLYNEDGSVVLVCNGEIFNYRELRERLVARGHSFRTRCDVEVLVHLYEEYGVELLAELNGQFAFAIYDRRERTLMLARDHFGINPLFYAEADGVLVFGSEIKAILEHPSVPRRVDLTGLDQVFSFPGLVSPRTMFEGVKSLRGGQYLLLRNGHVAVHDYWDLDYPRLGDEDSGTPEEVWAEEVREILARSVAYRLQADVPVGYYLSGGLDSSLIGALTKRTSPESKRHSFSITFEEREVTEASFQALASTHVGSIHHEIPFGWSEIADRMRAVIYHCECPIKESYNTCSMALSACARANGVPVVLTGEGADELFAGYVGYRFDKFGRRSPPVEPAEQAREDKLRERLWGDRKIFYEVDLHRLRGAKTSLYSREAAERFADFDCLNFDVVDTARLRDRHPLHQRSYLDFKLRLADHLLSDHGDRMALANAVEARYPFLDIRLVELCTRIPPNLKLNGFTEKYVLKRAARGLVPDEIVRREKFGFHAPGTPNLLSRGVEWVDDLLSYDRVRRQGYFDPDAVERLKRLHGRPGFTLDVTFESDPLMIVLTFNILLDAFGLPNLT